MRQALLGVFGVFFGATAVAQTVPVFDETAGFEVTGLSQEGQAAVSSGGHSFVCGLSKGAGQAMLENCVPILTPTQLAKIEADAALEARVSAAETASEVAKEELSAAKLHVSKLELELAAERELSKRTLEDAQTVKDLANAETTTLAKRLEELEAELDETRYMADLRALVIDLEVSSVNVSLRAPDQNVILAREGMQLIADAISDGCTLTKDLFQANEIEMQKLVQGHWLAQLGVRDDVIKLMIAKEQPKLYANELERFYSALAAAKEAGDGPTYDKGYAALQIASQALSKLDEVTEAALPEVVEPQADGSLRIKSVACRS